MSNQNYGFTTEELMNSPATVAGFDAFKGLEQCAGCLRWYHPDVLQVVAEDTEGRTASLCPPCMEVYGRG